LELLRIQLRAERGVFALDESVFDVPLEQTGFAYGAVADHDHLERWHALAINGAGSPELA